MSAKQLAVGLLVSMGALALCALSAEALLRLWDPLDLDWRMVAGERERVTALAAEFDGSLRGVRVKTNRFGHRVPTSWRKEYGADRPSGATRILVFGDSFTFGDEWPAEASFVEQLQQRLDPVCGRVQVLNFGVLGYGPVQEWRYLREEAMRFHPDVVIAQFADANDLIPFSPASPWGWLRRRSYLHWILADLWYHGRASALARLTARSRGASGETGRWLDSAQRAAARYYRTRLETIRRGAIGWQQALDSYRRMAAYLAKRRVPFVIMVTSPNWDLACEAWACQGASAPYREMLREGDAFYAALAGQLGALTPAYLSLNEVFAPYTVEELYDGPTWHYGPKKAAVVAARLERLLAQTALRQSAGAPE
jgi:hypothetical protein